jgi:hypothetical protein
MLVADAHRTTLHHPERSSHRITRLRPQSPHLTVFWELMFTRALYGTADMAQQRHPEQAASASGWRDAEPQLDPSLKSATFPSPFPPQLSGMGRYINLTRLLQNKPQIKATCCFINCDI